MTKDELIEEHRDWNVEHIDWWDSTYDMFKEDMQAKGIEVDRMYFSGFWSQGDGACFEGRIEFPQLFIDSHFRPDQYPMVRKLLACGGGVKLSVQHSGHYYHENCTTFDSDYDLLAYVMDRPSELHEQVVEAWQALLDAEMEDFRKDAIEIFKDHMRQLYKNLEAEYDYLTSDEAVWESLEANDMTAEVEEST